MLQWNLNEDENNTQMCAGDDSEGLMGRKFSIHTVTRDGFLFNGKMEAKNLIILCEVYKRETHYELGSFSDLRWIYKPFRLRKAIAQIWLG